MGTPVGHHLIGMDEPLLAGLATAWGVLKTENLSIFVCLRWSRRETLGRLMW